jgi:hypothetical protein
MPMVFLSQREGGSPAMSVLDVQHIVRPEVKLPLPLHVVDTEGDFSVCTGVSVGLGLHGVLALLDQPLPCTCETTVQVELPDGSELVVGAVVADSSRHGDTWIYWLVFQQLEDADHNAITSLLEI